MRSRVIDASALLAFLLAEPGGDAVASQLEHCLLSAVNYAETLTRTVGLGKPLGEAVADIGRLKLGVVPFDAEQAAVAASLREATKPFGLSLADRACLALGLTRGLPVLTADRTWTRFDVGVRVELVRNAETQGGVL